MSDDGLDLWWTNRDQVRTFPYMQITHAARIAAVALGSQSILEFGCGGSTLWLMQLVPHAQIMAIEEDRAWAETVRRIHKSFSGLIQTAELIVSESLKGWEVTPDLVIVDGRAATRPQQMAEAWSRLKPGGSMFLHDAERPAYRQAIDECVANGGDLRYDDRKTAIPASLVHIVKKRV